ncbi:MAG: SOS response-associated peptidase [Hyphomonadaceae bacterium]
MCGKFTQMATWPEVVAFSQPLVYAASERIVSTPMRMARIIRLNGQGARENVAMRWGFSKKGATTPARPDHMHARAETIDTRATFAHAFAHQRGVLLVHTFNEGEALASGKTRQWTVTPKDGAPLALAVVCEQWTNGDQSLWTFVQITVPANPLIAQITDRMPAILRPEDWGLWLGETEASLADVKALLKTYDDAGGWDFAPEQKPAKPKSATRDLLG